MQEMGLSVTIFFYNPNIHPRAEYEIRKEENKRFAAELGIPFVDADYDSGEWFARAKDAEEGASDSKSSASVRLSSSSLPSVSPTVNLVPYGIPSRNNSQERTTEHSQKHLDIRPPGTSQPTPQMSTIIPPQLTVSQPGLQGVELIYSPNPPSAAEESSAPTVYPEPSYQGLPPVAGGDGPVDELAQVHDVLLHIRSIIMTDEQLAYAHSHLVCPSL